MAIDQDFEDLFRRDYPKLVSFGIAMSGNVDVARDLAQETMSRAHEHWDSVSAADVPEAWLRRVMRNLLIDHHRRGRTETRTLERLAHAPGVPTPDVVDSRLAEMLAVLPERQRAATALYYVDDLSVAEIAETLSMAPGTVKATLWKARRSLKKYLSKDVCDV